MNPKTAVQDSITTLIALSISCALLFYSGDWYIFFSSDSVKFIRYSGSGTRSLRWTISSYDFAFKFKLGIINFLMISSEI